MNQKLEVNSCTLEAFIHQNSLLLARTFRIILFLSPHLLLTLSCSISWFFTAFFHSLFFSAATSDTKLLEHPNLAANLLRDHSAGLCARRDFISSIAASSRRGNGPVLLIREGRETGGSDGSVHDIGCSFDGDGDGEACRSGDAGETVKDSGDGRDGGGLWMNVRFSGSCTYVACGLLDSGSATFGGGR